MSWTAEKAKRIAREQARKEAAIVQAARAWVIARTEMGAVWESEGEAPEAWRPRMDAAGAAYQQACDTLDAAVQALEGAGA